MNTDFDVAHWNARLAASPDMRFEDLSPADQAEVLAANRRVTVVFWTAFSAVVLWAVWW